MKAVSHQKQMRNDLSDLEEGLPLTDEEYDNMKKAGPILPKPEQVPYFSAGDDGFDTPDIEDPFSHPR